MVSDEMCNHSAWWAAVSAEASDRSTGRARGYLQGKKFCSVPPFAGMNPSGGFKGPLQRHDGGQPLQLFVQVSLGLFFWSHQCKVRKTFHSTKIRQSFLLCVFCLSLPSLVLSRCEIRRSNLGACYFRPPQWQLWTLGELMKCTMIQWVGGGGKACSYIKKEATVIIFLSVVRPLIFSRARTASFIMPGNTWLHRSYSHPVCLLHSLTLCLIPPRPVTAANKRGPLSGSTKYACVDYKPASFEAAEDCNDSQFK